MARRHILLALAAIVAGGGCHAGTSNNLAKQEPPIAKETLSKTRIITQLNKNASTIHSLTAMPAIQVTADGRQYGLKGKLALERPKDFRLMIKSTVQNQADIGSNDQGFWFWVKDNKERAIYVCDYEHVNSSPLTATMQPDWIIEAMGLREISEREAQTISAKPGDKPGLLVLTQLRKDPKDPKGEMLTKETIVDEVKGTIVEHRLYAGAKKELLARATISEYQKYELLPTEAEPAGSQVSIPSKLQLDWIVEKFSIELTMPKVTINPQFRKDMRADLFTEPSISGVTRTNLAGQGAQASASSSWIRESMPRSGVQLGQPEADLNGNEGAMRTPGNPAPLASNPPTTLSRSLGVVGPMVPRGTDPEAVQVSSSRNRLSPIIEQ